MKFIIILILFFYCISNSNAQNDKKYFYYYSGDISVLNANGVWPIEIKEKKITRIGSKAGFDMYFGNSWYQNFSIDLYSSNSLLPLSLGLLKEEEIHSLSVLSLLIGKPELKMPVFYLSSVNFSIVGTLTYKDYPLYFEKGRRVEKDNIRLFLKINTLYISKISDNYKFNRKTKGLGYFFGYGLVRTLVKGIHEEWYDNTSSLRNKYKYAVLSKEEAIGIGIKIGLRYGTLKFTPSTKGYFKCNCHVLLSNVGMLKAGYETGLLINYNKNVFLRPYIGGYFWLIEPLIPSFESFSTDLGWNAGLQFEYEL